MHVVGRARHNAKYGVVRRDLPGKKRVVVHGDSDYTTFAVITALGRRCRVDGKAQSGCRPWRMHSDLRADWRLLCRVWKDGDHSRHTNAAFWQTTAQEKNKQTSKRRGPHSPRVGLNSALTQVLQSDTQSSCPRQLRHRALCSNCYHPRNFSTGFCSRHSWTCSRPC